MSHGLWNGMTYVLFGFGTKIGALGVARTAIYGPEAGLLGLAVNGAVAGVAWLLWRKAHPRGARPSLREDGLNMDR